MKYTAEEVRAIAKRLHDDITVVDGDALMASDMLTAYAERIKADEGAGPVGDGLPLTNTFVQEVPDKCDRIIWRGRYYHLHEGHSPASPAPDKEG